MTKRQTIVHIKLQRTQKTKQNEPKKTRKMQALPEGSTVPVPLVKPVKKLLKNTLMICIR